MSLISNTTLPENFVEQVMQHVRTHRRDQVDYVEEAILAVLHRPLTASEKWALIDQAAGNSPGVTLNQEVVDRIARGGRL